MRNKMKFWLIFSLMVGIVVMPMVLGLQSGPYMIVTLDKQTPDPVEANDIVELRFSVRNAGSNYADDVAVKLEPNYPFTIVDSETKYLGTMVGGQGVGEGVVVKFKLRLDKDAPEGNHSVKLSYRVNGNWLNTPSFIVDVRTQDAIIGVEGVETIPSKVIPGQEFEYKVRIKNYADSLLKDVRVKLNFTASTFTTVNNADEIVIKKLNAAESREISFKVISQGDAASTIYSIPIEIRYLDNLGNKYVRNTKAGVMVQDEIQYIINIDQTDVYSGQDTGKVSFSFYNTGTSDINFVTFELMEGDDYEILSPNVVYLGNVDSDDFESADYNVYIRKMKKDVDFKLRIKYKNSYNKDFTEEISIPLKLYSEKDAIKFKLKQVQNKAGQIISGMFIVLILAFWLSMLIDCYRSKMRMEKKYVWFGLMILSTIFGAIAYYFLARGRSH